MALLVPRSLPSHTMALGMHTFASKIKTNTRHSRRYVLLARNDFCVKWVVLMILICVKLKRNWRSSSFWKNGNKIPPATFVTGVVRENLEYKAIITQSNEKVNSKTFAKNSFQPSPLLGFLCLRRRHYFWCRHTRNPAHSAALLRPRLPSPRVRSPDYRHPPHWPHYDYSCFCCWNNFC